MTDHSKTGWKNILGKCLLRRATGVFEGQKKSQKMGKHHKRALRNERRLGLIHEYKGFVFYLSANAEMRIHCEWSPDHGSQGGSWGRARRQCRILARVMVAWTTAVTKPKAIEMRAQL